MTAILERRESESLWGRNGIDFTRRENSTDFDLTQKYRHLWVQCENCYGLNYKKLLKSKMNICDQCGYHLKMSSSDRIELSIDPGTWDPILVLFYSDNYMSHDQGYLRFFAYMSFFNTSMLGLVTSSNLIQIYIFWELVGMY